MEGLKEVGGDGFCHELGAKLCEPISWFGLTGQRDGKAKGWIFGGKMVVVNEMLKRGQVKGMNIYE